LAISKEYLAAGSDASSELREGYARADMTFFNQIRGKIGGRVRRLYSTMATLPQHLVEFFEAIGLLPLNIYGLTEAGGFPVISLPDARRYGSCGRVAPDFQIRIANDGEVLVKGATVMRGYWQRPEETRHKIDVDGWLHTGDLGYCDEDGYIYLTGRKEALAVLSTGRKVISSHIEKALMSSPFIVQAVVFGEGRPYVSALLVPDLEALADDFQESTNGDESTTIRPVSETLKWYWLPENQDDELLATTAHPEVKTLLDKAVNQVNSRLGYWEQIKTYSLLEQAFSPAADELNELMPAGRHRITQKYQAQIEAMYPQTLQMKGKEITEVQVSPERLRELLAKENILDAWMADAGIEFLFKLARAKQIDAPSMVHICDIAASIAQMEHEGRPLSTALIVGDPARIAHHLPPSQIQLLGHDHIRRMRKMLFTLAPVIDGLVLGFIVDKHGYIRGIHKLTVTLPEQPATFLLGPQFRRHAAISGECDAVVFFVPSGGKQARVFANGELVGRYSNGDWSPESIFKVGAVMAKLVEQKNYDLALVQRVLRCAFRMSEENLGAIFIIGNADTILEHSDAPEISHFALIISADMATLTDEELINFAKQDGATMIDTDGQFRGCMVFLRPGADTPAEIGPGKGARHSSAAKISAEAQCLAITVSQDGPISIYDSGRRMLSL
jgi:DNA integrity scanning protein DisA with diadenylate cyclase activity